MKGRLECGVEFVLVPAFVGSSSAWEWKRERLPLQGAPQPVFVSLHVPRACLQQLAAACGAPGPAAFVHARCEVGSRPSLLECPGALPCPEPKARGFGHPQKAASEGWGLVVLWHCGGSPGPDRWQLMCGRAAVSVVTWHSFALFIYIFFLCACGMAHILHMCI